MLVTTKDCPPWDCSSHSSVEDFQQETNFISRMRLSDTCDHCVLCVLPSFWSAWASIVFGGLWLDILYHSSDGMQSAFTSQHSLRPCHDWHILIFLFSEVEIGWAVQAGLQYLSIIPYHKRNGRWGIRAKVSLKQVKETLQDLTLIRQLDILVLVIFVPGSSMQCLQYREWRMIGLNEYYRTGLRISRTSKKINY